jgi:uncharacterized protein
VNLSARHPLRLNVGFMIRQNVGFSRDFDFDLSAVEVSEDLLIHSLQGTLTLSRIAQGILAQGRLQAKMPQECARCLAEFNLPLTIKLKDLFTYPPNQGSDPILVVAENGILDLNPLLRESVLLEIPMRPLCRPECKGLCPVCGANRNNSKCKHPEQKIDPRMAALKSLLPKR